MSRSVSDLRVPYLLLLFISAAVLVTTFYYKEESLGLQLNTNINQSYQQKKEGHGPKVRDRTIGNENDNDNLQAAPVTNYILVNKINMASRLFTQGLEFINNTHLIISGGLYKKSFIGVLAIDFQNEINNGQGGSNAILVAKQSIPSNVFGEGATIFNGLVYQLTWRERKIYEYNLNDLSLRKTYDMPSQIREGWGIGHDDKNMYITEGSNKVYAV